MRGLHRFFSIDKESVWVDKDRERGIAEVEVHRERKAKWRVRLCVMGIVKEHVERVGRIERKVGCSVVGAVCFSGAHRRRR